MTEQQEHHTLSEAISGGGRGGGVNFLAMQWIWTKIGTWAKAEIWRMTQGQICELPHFRSLTQQSGQCLDGLKAAQLQ